MSDAPGNPNPGNPNPQPGPGNPAQPPYGQQYPAPPYPPQQQYGQPVGYPGAPPAKKKHTLRNVLLILVLVMVLFIGGCLALLGTAADQVSKSITNDENKAGGQNNPLVIHVGKPFEVDHFNYAAGWSVRKDFGGDVDIRGLKVTNNRSRRDSALVEIKFMRGQEVVARADCSTEPILVGQTTTLSCISTDKLPRKYDRITINDSF